MMMMMMQHLVGNIIMIEIPSEAVRYLLAGSLQRLTLLICMLRKTWLTITLSLCRWSYSISG